MPQEEAASRLCETREGTVREERVVADRRDREAWAMSASRLIKRSVLGVLIVVLLTTVDGASSASALEPWWHLTSGARPTTIQPGVAQNEAQEVAVSGNEGRFLLVGPEFKLAFFEWDATHEEVREGLEGIYGKGNVTVAGGPGDETGSKPYVVTFTGELAGTRVEPMNAEASMFFLECKAGSGPGCRKEATVTERTKGRPDGQIVVTASNLGDTNANGEVTPVTITDKLPAGLRAVGIEGLAGPVSRPDGAVQCSLDSLSCTYAGTLPAYDQIEVVISVVVENASPGGTNEVSVSGGEAKGASIQRSVAIGGTPAAFGGEDYEMVPEEEGGTVDTQAGSHMFQLTTTFTLNQTGEGSPVQLAKDLHFKLPPGLIGNPTPFPRCTLAQFNTIGNDTSGGLNMCPPQSAVGVAIIAISGKSAHLSEGTATFTVPVFNIEPSVGEPARFGFELIRAPVFLDTKVRTGGDYGVTVDVKNITQTAAFIKNEVTFWGVPDDPRHDQQRGWACLADVRGAEFFSPCEASKEQHPLPLLTLPTSCSGSPLQTSVEMDSWTEPESRQSLAATQPMPTMDGCNRLPFSPSISVAPDSQAGSTPSGLTVGVHVPQDLNLNGAGLSEADVKDTTVTLPAGVALNPAAADGLQTCGEAQVALSEDVSTSCPEASKVATVEIKSPLLPEPLVGEAYLAAQNANPFGTLVALYIVAEDPTAGVLVKVAGEVKPDPVTGQLVSTFKNTPQLPFEDLKLHFFGGSRAPLSSPALCGSYTTTSSIAPWSGNAPAEPSSEFQILTGPNGSACANPLPFNPALTAGTTSIQAGGFSPFTMTMSRPDGSQNLQAVKLRMPPGLLGTLATVRLCKEAEANAGTCGPESLIGHTIVSVGVGGNPYSVTGGEVFITEGYEGAPYGLSIVNPAKAGPYDLGKVIVRAKIEVDPITAALTVTTDTTGPYKIPTILDGIPLQIQHVNVSIDRPGFTFNPTNCSPLQIGGSLTSDQGAVQALSVPFQVTNCAVLAFKPHLTAKTNGKTSRANGASLSVKLTYPAGPFDANISKVKVDLPKQLPSRLTTLQKACPAATFNANPAACPSASIVGHAKATTPVLPVALEGPAYFVSHGGEEFPQLVIVLQGYGTTVHLVGSTFINKAGITSSTFKQVPDVPVGTFELTLPQGKFSALAANGNLCTTKKLAMPTSFVAQNGVVLNTSTPIVPTGCAKKAHKASKHHKGTKHKRKK
jgi:hypothetical protein